MSEAAPGRAKRFLAALAGGLAVFGVLLALALAFTTGPAADTGVGRFIHDHGTWVPWIVVAGVAAAYLRRGRWVEPLAFGTGMAAGHAALIALALFFVFRTNAPDPILFDPAAWRDSARVRDEHVRLAMIDHLLESQDLHGRTRAEVVALLGEPPETAYFAEYDLVYWLGPERSPFGMDSEWLVVRLGPDGRVAEHRIARD